MVGFKGAHVVSDRSIGPRLPMDILVARNSPRKPHTVSLSYSAQ
jgi:hypothetical protein